MAQQCIAAIATGAVTVAVREEPFHMGLFLLIWRLHCQVTQFGGSELAGEGAAAMSLVSRAAQTVPVRAFRRFDRASR